MVAEAETVEVVISEKVEAGAEVEVKVEVECSSTSVPRNHSKQT